MTTKPKKLKGSSFAGERLIAKWKSVVRIGNKIIHLGYYKTELEAHEAWKAAKADPSQILEIRKRAHG